MGGERSSTTRMRLSGRICCSCKSPMPSLADKPGERLCDECRRAQSPRHRVYMSFMSRDGWYCQFLEVDAKTPLPRKLNFKYAAKVRELAEKGRGFANLETRQSFDHGLATGRGGIWLQLSDEQYRKLKMH